MPNWTNVHNIDPAIAQAVMNDPYDRGDADISVTGLLRPPQMAALERAHEAKLTRDVSDGLWLLLGQAIHHIVAQGRIEGAVKEHRLFTEVLGWRVSGAFDVWYGDTNTLKDYKITSVWTWVYGGRSEWTAQLNLYAYLAHLNGIQVDELKIAMIFRDWQARQAQENSDYPPRPFMEMDIPIWTKEDAQRFLYRRVADHQQLKPDPCSDEERWARPDTWAVKKPHLKRAYRVFPSEFKARQFLGTLNGKHQEYEVQYRPGVNVRCESYCPVVQFCPQARELGITGGNDEEIRLLGN